MKTKVLLVFFMLLAIANSNILGQSFNVKTFNNKLLSGDVIIKKSEVKVDTLNNYSYTIFEIDAPNNGNYYFSAWYMAIYTDNGYLSYEIMINGKELKEKVEPEKSNWQTFELQDVDLKKPKTVKLNKGVNLIVFKSKLPHIAQVEFIKLSEKKENSIVSNKKYIDYVNSIKKQATSKVTVDTFNDNDTLAPTLKSTLPNPNGNYYHYVDAPCKYTWFTSKYCPKYTKLTINTLADNNYRHVLEVFSWTKPENYSWVALSSTSNGQASITVTIPYTDSYMIRVRAYNQNTNGIVDVQGSGAVSGNFYYYDCPVSGFGIAHTHTTPRVYNYFTSHYNNCDPMIFIEAYNTKIIAWNDQYYETGDFDWQWNARVKKDLPVTVDAALISSYSSYNPSGTCDIYMKCYNSTIYNSLDHLDNKSFPDLKADDAIQSAPETNTYNCISWSGGITDYWEWPLDLLSDYYIPGDPEGSFDSFYEARGYTQIGATSTNSVVDLWYNPNYYDIGIGNYTHASATKPGNNHPHGYDWESKPGGLMRTFHPRNSLNNTAIRGYGFVYRYYTLMSKKSTVLAGKMLDELIAEGLVVMENVQFTENEKHIIYDAKYELSPSIIAELEAKYNAWKVTWAKPENAIHSDPRIYAKSKEYDDFISYCKKQGKSSWPFIFEKYEQGDFFVINALEDLIIKENMNVLEAVKNENRLKSSSESGALIVRSPYSNGMKYIKKLLAFGDNSESVIKDISYSNADLFSIHPNPTTNSAYISFNLMEDSKVSLDIFDCNGNEVDHLLTNKIMSLGNHDIPWNSENIRTGVYLVKLVVNGNINVQKLCVE